MYNQPYFIPGYFASATPNIMRGAINGTMGRTMGGALRNTVGASRGLGLFGRLGSSMKAIKGVNWGSLITNTSKTLNVVNQAIPLVRQVGPMMTNMKSMLRIASIFKDETDVKPLPRIKQNTNNFSSVTTSNNFSQKESNTIANHDKQIDYSDNSPTFFINS